MRTINLLLLLFLLGAAAARAQEGPLPEINSEDAQAREREALRDRLSASLLLRGELADRIIENNMSAKLVDMKGVQTHSDLRLLLLDWIKQNPDKAAWLSLHFKNGGGEIPDIYAFETTKWVINPHFMEMVKALSAAARDSRVSSEGLEAAARRLYEGSATGGDAPPPVVGGGGTGTGFFAGNYAEFKLNRAGLDRELAGGGAMLDALRGPGGRGPGGAEREYSAAVAEYGTFVVAASAVRGRTAITSAESSGLEAWRTALSRALAALEVRARTAALEAFASGFPAGGRAGTRGFAGSASRLGGRLENLLARLEGGQLSLKEFGAGLGALEKDFADFYIKYSFYSGLLGLKARAQAAGFSCFYDYALWRALARFFPGTALARARAELAASSSGLEAALRKAEAGNFGGALACMEGRAARMEAALGVVREASVYNRAAQFFLWGIIFRPFEVEVSVRNGKPFMMPSVTFFRLAPAQAQAPVSALP